MRKITGSNSPMARLDPHEHGDQEPVATPADQIIAETLRSEAGAFDIAHPTPTPGFQPPGKRLLRPGPPGNI